MEVALTHEEALADATIEGNNGRYIRVWYYLKQGSAPPRGTAILPPRAAAPPVSCVDDMASARFVLRVQRQACLPVDAQGVGGTYATVTGRLIQTRIC